MVGLLLSHYCHTLYTPQLKHLICVGTSLYISVDRKKGPLVSAIVSLLAIAFKFTAVKVWTYQWKTTNTQWATESSDIIPTCVNPSIITLCSIKTDSVTELRIKRNFSHSYVISLSVLQQKKNLQLFSH